MLKHPSRLGISIAVGLLIFVALLLVRSFHLLDTLELKTLDYRYVLRGPYTGMLGRSDLSNESLDVVLVDIDDESHRLIPHRLPYPRDIWATAVDNLTRAGAEVIVFDLEFDSEDDKSRHGDSLFAASIRRAQNQGTEVVLAAKMVQQPTQVPSKYVQGPIPTLQAANPDIGLVAELKDMDGFTRRYILFDYLEREDRVYLSLGLKAVAEYLEFPASAELHQDEEALHFGPLDVRTFKHPGVMLINYYGPPSHGGPPGADGGPWMTFRRYPLSNVLDDAAFELKEPREDTNWMEMFYQDGMLAEFGFAGESPFKDKIVVIGTSLDELHDVKETPFFQFAGYQHLMPGMETHANAIQQMLDKNYIHDASELTIVIVLLLMILITAVVVSVAKPLMGGIITLVLGWLYVDISFGVFFQDFFWSLNRIFYLTVGQIQPVADVATSLGLEYTVQPPAPGTSVYIPVVAPLLGIFLTYGANVVYQYLAELREKRWIRDAFGHFLNPQVVEELMDNPDKLSLGGERRYLTVFFSDIQNFTTISEKMAPEALSEFLNEYLSEVTEIILSYNGIIDKYEGDAVMAEFGAPLPTENHATQACHAAIDIQKRLSELQEQWREKDLPEIWTRIGVNSGVVALGNFGSKEVFDYTAMGDAVNLGARLEAANKQYGTYIMISESTRQEVEGEFTIRFLDSLVVKGKTEPVRVYELVGREEDGTLLFNQDHRLLNLYSSGIEHYFNRNWEAGIAAFEEALQVNNSDGPSRVFLKRCREYLEHPPPDDWDGVFRMN